MGAFYHLVLLPLLLILAVNHGTSVSADGAAAAVRGGLATSVASDEENAEVRDIVRPRRSSRVFFPEAASAGGRRALYRRRKHRRYRGLKGARPEPSEGNSDDKKKKKDTKKSEESPESESKKKSKDDSDSEDSESVDTESSESKKKSESKDTKSSESKRKSSESDDSDEKASSKSKTKSSGSDDHDSDSDDSSSSSSSSDSSSSSSSDSDDDEGKPSKIEFKHGSDNCFSFDDNVKGEELVVDDCDDAPKFVYNDDRLLKLDKDDDLCLEADESDEVVKLEECDEDKKKQQWYFVETEYDGDDYYRIKNRGTGDYIEMDDDEVKLKRGDDDEVKQLIEEPDDDFFP